MDYHVDSEWPWRRRARVAAWMLHLQLRNATCTTPAAGGRGPTVSLTSYGRRISTVHLTLESIAEGTLLPRRTILWLDDRTLVAHPPAALQRLQRRGVELRATPDYGPHKKYFPYVMSEPIDGPVVTADDDILYPRWWLKGLSDAYAEDPGSVHAYRAHLAELEPGGQRFKPYGSWQPCTSSAPSYLHFSTGCSGVLLPAGLQAALKASGPGFVDKCPMADDVWINMHAQRSGYPVRQVRSESIRFLGVLLTQTVGLYRHNVMGGENDAALRRTFGDYPRSAMVAE